MCFAYSGRCLISAVQMGRSSNRGACANDCRFKYELYAKGENNDTLFRLEEDESGTHIFNSKDLNLSAHIAKIIESGAVDSLKIEGRTKSEYYAACTAGAYRRAIDDAVAGCFDPKIYADELNTLKNRGFSDGYLISRPFEKSDSQNLQTSISEGSAQVDAFSEDGKTFKAKGQVFKNKAYELLSPANEKISLGEDEIGRVYQKEGKTFVEFKKLISPTGKAFESVHSGNVNDICLPAGIPPFSFLRSKTENKDEK